MATGGATLEARDACAWFGDRLVLDGALLKPDGSAEIRARCSGAVGEAERLGAELGGELRRRAGSGFGLD